MVATTTDDLVFDPTSNSAGGENVPEGLWLVEVADIQPWQDPNPESQYYNPDPQAKWIFKLIKNVMVPKPRPTQDAPNPKPIEGWLTYEMHDYSTLKTGKKAKARAWSEALLQVELPDEGYRLKKSELIGRRAVAQVGRSQGGRHKIMSLTPTDDDAPATQAAPGSTDQLF